ncbi:MAG TPA: hypothetical protein VFE14_09640 [Micromonosporaceae bacterium]|jgi:hypothetical protein|nr:hypothetical protein [Micromonosporaceae bacterium]
MSKSKARKPNEEALRTVAKSRIDEMPAETAGGRLDMADEASRRREVPGDQPPPDERQRNQPRMKPKR